MLRTFLTTLLLVAVASTASAQPNFEAVKFTYGQFGPVRSSATFYRQDEVCLHYSLTGLQTDAEGHIDMTLENKLLDPNGTIALRNSGGAKTDLHLGGGALSGLFTLPLDHPYLPEGTWTIEVTATDNLAKASTTLTRKWDFKPKELAISRLAIARDDQYKVPARTTALVVGQMVFLREKIVGFAREKGKMEIDVEMHMVDTKGDPVMMPREFPCRHQLEGEAGPMEAWDLTTSILPNRPGDFVLRLVAHDRVAKKTATVEIPLHVENP